MRKSLENFIYESPVLALAVLSLVALSLIFGGSVLKQRATNNHGLVGEPVICEVYTDVASFIVERKDIEISRELPIVEINLPQGRKVTTTNFTMDCN